MYDDPVLLWWSIQCSCSSVAGQIFSTKLPPTPQASAQALTTFSVSSFRLSVVMGDPASMVKGMAFADRNQSETLIEDEEFKWLDGEENVKNSANEYE